MAFNAGRVTTFSIDDSGGTSRDLSSYTENASINLSGDVLETTTFGASGDARTYIRGLNGGTLSASGFVDETATTGPNDVLEGLPTNTSTSSFDISFDGGTTNYTGECFVTSFDVTAAVGGVAAWSMDATITGSTTRS